MECERCGCDEQACGNLLGKRVFKMHTKSNCIAALKAKLAEQEKPVEPTKPERFAGLRKITSMKSSCFTTWSSMPTEDVTQELKDILAAYDEAATIIQNYWCNGFGGVAVNGWLKKWG